MNTQNPLETQPIGKLMIRFSVPCIISMLVNSLYNLVDQIFIGWGVGYLGNGATNVVFPFTLIAMSLALMFGDGAASFLSIKLGEKKKDAVRCGIGNTITVSVVVGIVLMIVALVFFKPLVYLFGCTDTLYPHALEYGITVIIGLPFVIVCTALSSLIRADGNPRYSMIVMIVGCVTNIILDAIFVFPLHMGIFGAALATVIGQVVSFVIAVCYIPKFKSAKVSKESLKPHFPTIGKVASLGVSSFITQISIVILSSVANNMMKIYGAQSIYGVDIPITAIGITMKVNQILTSILVGISVGAQPIIGYNYGARNGKRVQQTLKIALLTANAVSFVAFLLFQFAPMMFVSMFGSEEGLYNEFAVLCFRIFLLCCIPTAIHTVCSIFLQAIGKPIQSAFLSLSRQIIFFIPACLILPRFFGVIGVLWSGPAADGLAFICAVIITAIEVRKLKIKGQAEGVSL